MHAMNNDGGGYDNDDDDNRRINGNNSIGQIHERRPPLPLTLGWPW